MLTFTYLSMAATTARLCSLPAMALQPHIAGTGCLQEHLQDAQGL